MRGPLSSDRRAMCADAGSTASDARPHASDAMSVVCDLSGDDPVSDEELDVLEAFLMRELRHILDDTKDKPGSKQLRKRAIQDEDCMGTEIRS